MSLNIVVGKIKIVSLYVFVMLSVIQTIKNGFLEKSENHRNIVLFGLDEDL